MKNELKKVVHFFYYRNKFSQISLLLLNSVILQSVYVQACPYESLEESILPSESPLQQEMMHIPIYDLQSYNSIGFGFWSQCQPLFEPKSYPNVDYKFQESSLINGQLLMTVYGKTHTMLLYAYFDIQNQKVFHILNLYDNFSFKQMYFTYSALEYEGQWLFTFITLQQTIEKQIKVIFQMSNQNYYLFNNLDIQENTTQQILIGGRGYIMKRLNLDIYRGYQTYLYQKQVFFWNKKSFLEILDYCSLPKTSEGNLMLPSNGLMNYDGSFLTTSSFRQVGRNYCLSGWFKIDFSKFYLSLNQMIMRITALQNYKLYTNDGDELIFISVDVDIENIKNTELQIQSDMHKIPIKGAIGQYSKTKLISILDKKSNTIYEGLQQWFFLQYEYGRKSDYKYGLLSVQFFNKAGLIQKEMGDSIYGGNFRNTQYYIFIGGDELFRNYMVAQTFNLKFQYNYDNDKQNLDIVCHHSCKTCSGPFYNNCLNCQENQNRFYQKDKNTCDCKYDMVEQTEICLQFSSFYPLVKKNQQLYDQIYCPIGYFQIPKQDGNFICFQCPEQNEYSIFCAECYFYSSTWYLNPQCLSDIISVKEIKDFGLNQQYRDHNQIDQYIIDQYDNLLLKPGLFKICDFNQCQPTQLTHLGNKISIECKTNFIYENGDCIYSQLNCKEVFKNQCITCIEGMYLQNYVCVPCDNHCLICNNKDCIKCEKEYNLINNQCIKCGTNCKYCGSYYDQNLQKSYLKCYQCKDDSKYFFAFDGVNCLENQILNCEHAFQSLKSNIKYNTLDIYFLQQTDLSSTEIHCARCLSYYIYVFESKVCMKGLTLSCTFAYAQKFISYNPNNQVQYFVTDEKFSYSTSEQFCLIYWDQQYSLQQFSEVCKLYIPFCVTCIYRDTHKNVDCLNCELNYYQEKITGKCRPCPLKLNCLQCYEEQILFQDDWKQRTRAFYQQFINSNNDHFFSKFAQSQNPNDYQIKCSTCKDGFDLYQNTCIESCPQNCAECQIIDSKNVCVRCFQIEKGIQLTLVNNQCISCPENCALCRIREHEEIKAINPLFNTTYDDLKRFSYQCLKSFEDYNYFYDSSINNFIQRQDFSQGCQNKYEINFNLYCNIEEFIKDLNSAPIEQQHEFLQRNIEISQLQNINTFSEYDTYNFYKMANLDIIKSIAITITSQKQQTCQITKESYFNQLFSKQIFSAIDVSLTIRCIEETKFQIYSSLIFSNFSSVTLDGLIIESMLSPTIFKEINFNSVFLQKLYIRNCQLIQSSKQNIMIKFTFDQANHLEIQNFTFVDSNYNNKIFVIAETNFPKVIKLSDFQFIKSVFTNSSIFELIIGEKDQVIVTNFFISSIFKSSKLIQSISPESLGQINIENLKIQNATIINSVSFLDIKIFSHSTINRLQILNSTIIDSFLFLLGDQIDLNFFILQSCQLNQENLILYNNLDGFVQQNQNFILQNIKISDNIYSINTKIILLRKYNNYQSQLNLSNLEISNNKMSDTIIIYNPQLINNSMINIQIDKITIDNALINRGFGINDISIFNAKSLVISNFLIKQDEHHHFLTLHQSLDCFYKNIPGELFTTSIILFSIETLLLKDFYVYDIISINHPTIYYKSEDTVKSIEQENILIQNFTMNQNVLVLTKLQKRVSLILIESSQNINIQVKQISINSNILQEYEQDTSFESSLALNFNVPTGQVEIQNSNFQYNQIFNTTSSLMLIKSNKLTIQNSIFQNNNLFSYELIRRQLFWPFNKTIEVFIEDIKLKFPIKSISGNGLLDVKNFQFINSTISQSTGQNGAGFHIIAYKISQIIFQDIKVESIQTYFESNEEYGGAFYIDGSFAQQINVQIKNLTATNILSRSKGGLMFLKIGAIRSKIIINQITASNMYSLFGSLIYIEFQKNNNEEQLVILSNINFKSDYKEWKTFVNLFNNIQIIEKQCLFNQRSIIQITSPAQVQLKNSKFYNLIYESAIVFNDLHDVLLDDILFIDSQIINQLIHIVPSQYMKSNIVVKDIFAKNISFGIVQSQAENENCLQQTELKIFPNQWVCKTSNNLPPTQLNSQRKSIDQIQANCLNQQMIDGIDMSVSGLFLFESQGQNNNFVLKNINFFDIQCSNCSFGLIWIKKSSIKFQIQTVSNLKILNSSCGLKGCLVIQNYKETSRILNSHEQFIFNYQQALLIQNYICQFNNATNGTCISIESSKTILKNNFFTQNAASQNGGAIYIEDIQNVLIIQSNIENNTASFGGGIYLKDQQQLLYQKLSTLIYNNHAKVFSDDIATIPSKLKISLGQLDGLRMMMDINKTTQNLIETIYLNQQTNYYGFTSNSLLLPNGQKISDYQIFDWKSQSYKHLNLLLRVKPYDENNDQVKNLFGSSCQISSRTINISKEIQDSYFSKSYQIIFNETTQDYNLDDQIFYFDNDLPQNLYLQIQFHCSNIQIPTFNDNYPYEITSTHNNYFLRLNVRSFPCQLGEIKTDQNSCQICDSELGLFSLQINQTRCSIKDEISTLSVTPVQLQLRAGYWRPTFNSKVISDCYNSQSNCQGGWNTGDSSCFLGHIGALCEQCDIYNTRGDGQYAINEKFSCGSCVDKWKNFTLIVFISIWTLFSISISVQGTINNLESKAKQSTIGLNNLNIVSRTVGSAILIKMLTNYFQIISSVATFRIDISSSILSIISAAGSPIQSLIYSLDCFLINVFNFEIIYSKMIWQLIMPFIYLNIFFIFFVISLKIKSQKFSKSSITTSMIYLYIYFQPTFIGELIGLVSYRNISNILWVQSNVSYRYITNTHISWILKFCIPIIVLLAILIPIYLLFGLIRNKFNFQEKNTKLIWGYLYIEYKEEAFFWEILKIIEKEFIIIALTFYDDYIVLKAMILIFILLVYSHFYKQFEPYKNVNLNKLDYLATYICLITFSLAIGAYISKQQNIEYIKIIFFVFILLFNIYLLFYFIKTILTQIVFETNEKFLKQLDLIRLYLRGRFPIIKKFKWFSKLLELQQEKKERVHQNFKKVKEFLIPKAKEIIKLKNIMKNYNSKSSFNSNANIKSLDELLIKSIQISKTPKVQQTPSNNMQEFYPFQKFSFNFDIKEVKEDSFQNI